MADAPREERSLDQLHQVANEMADFFRDVEQAQPQQNQSQDSDQSGEQGAE